ncbi:Mu-like prophage protein Com [compost metagenome]
MLQEFRCSKCNKLLGKIEGRAEIICTRCKVLNEFNVPDSLRTAPETSWYNDQREKFREVNELRDMERQMTISSDECIDRARDLLGLPPIGMRGESRDDQVIRSAQPLDK